MANITPIKNKDGLITSYRIKVYSGRDANGKALKPYSMNWKVPKTYRKQSAIDKAVQKVAAEFEAECRRGEVSTDRRTFAEYCDYFIEMNKPNWKPTTTHFYNRLMPLIRSEIGSVKLNQLSAEHLNRFYMKLRTADVKADSKATAKDALIEKRKALKAKSKDIVAGSGLCDNTVRICFKQKHIAVNSAVKIAEYFDMPLADAFTISTSGKGLSPKFVRHYHNFIHCVLEQAVKEKCVVRNVADLATVPKLAKHEAEFFEVDEVEKMILALNNEPLKYQVAFYILLFTGIRRGELVGLQWDAVNMDRCEISVKNNVIYTGETGLISQTTKSGEGRLISFPGELVPLLERYKQEQKTELRMRFSDIQNNIERKSKIDAYNKEGYLFTQDNGCVMTPNAVNHWLIRFSEKVGFRVHPHKFRHTQASLLIAKGVDVVTVSKRLGHAQVSTTQNIYSHCLKKADEQCANVMSDLFCRKSS